MSTRIDHLIMLVADLDDWIAKADKAGFTVSERRDIHGKPLAHRLICFDQGSYLELIKVEPGDPHAPAWAHTLVPLGDGFGAFSINVDSIEETIALIPGFENAAIHEGGNVVENIGEWKMRVATPEMTDGLTRPFVLEDVAGGNIRVPDADSRVHPNGANRLLGIELAVSDLDLIANELSAVFGAPSRQEPVEWSSDFGLKFSLGGQSVTAHVPAPDSWAADLMAVRGPGPVAVVIGRRDAETSNALRSEAAIDSSAMRVNFGHSD